MLRKITRTLLLTLLLALVCFGQTADDTSLRQDTKIPIIIDEFGRMGDCETRGRLDNFLVRIQENPDAAGYIIIYQGKNALPAEYEVSSYEKIIRSHLAFRNFDASRVTFLNGGFREELSIELWLIPSGANEPTPTNTVSAPVMPKGKTFLYDKKNLDSELYNILLDEFILPSVKAQTEEANRLAEEQIKADESNLEQPVETEVETVEDNFEVEQPTPKEIEEAKFSWVNEKFGAIIKKQKGSSGVIIFYADDAYYDVNELQNLFEAGKRKIAEANKISAAKIQVLYGGYRDTIEAEFWVVPKKGESPTPHPDERTVEGTEN